MGCLVEKDGVSTARREDSPSGMLLPGPTVRSIRRRYMSDAVRASPLPEYTVSGSYSSDRLRGALPLGSPRRPAVADYALSGCRLRPRKGQFGGETRIYDVVCPRNGQFGGQTGIYDVVCPRNGRFGG